MPRLHRPDLSLRPGGVMIVDDVGMAVSQGSMPMRMAVRLGAFPTLMLMRVMLVMCVQMLMLQRLVVVFEQFGVGRAP